MDRRIRTAVLISGSGSNLQALMDAAKAPDCPYEIVLVISNRAEAGGLARAQAAGIKALTIAHKAFDTREAFDAAIDVALRAARIELVCLAGFMRILTADFIGRWTGRLINIHPSLLPSFRGLHTHQQALDAGVKLHGCTVHHVVPELDAGPIIAQAALPVLPDDTPETLAARLLPLEHKLYPEAAKAVANSILDQPTISLPANH
jgi:phosphoribosylglycinamide formyltransferase 1